MLFNRKYGKFGSIVLPLELFILVLSPLVLIAIAVVSGILLYGLSPLLIPVLLGAIAWAFLKRSNMISAIIDTEISGFIGTARALRKKDATLWARVR
jgi:hypothetical protein